MPQASNELRDQMGEYFGDRISQSSPALFLKSQGYTLHGDWTWSHPTIKTLEAMPRKDFECLLFLIHEWDFGSLRKS